MFMRITSFIFNAAVVMFGFRLFEGLGPDQLSIWVGPLHSVPGPVPGEFRKAA